MNRFAKQAEKEKKALLRLVRIYVPIFIAFYLILYIIGWSMQQKEPKKLDDVVISAWKTPVVYSPAYNIKFFGLEKLHPFDSSKYEKIYGKLLQDGVFTNTQSVPAGVPSNDKLKLVHSDDYLRSIQHSWTIARMTELNFLRFFPSILARNVVLVPMLYQTGGSILAGELTLKNGWAINLGGGFHHASSHDGGGFCVLADITISIRSLLKTHPDIHKVMIIDLDAHQGNGHERDFYDDPNIFVVDLFNHEIYPHDEYAKKKINVKRELRSYIGDKLYLKTEQGALEEAFTKFKPDVIYYNAGTDILEGDPLGGMSVSPEGVVRRDEMVFQQAFDRKIPIVMLLSGGYQKSNAAVIASSIENLNKKFGLFKVRK